MYAKSILLAVTGALLLVSNQVQAQNSDELVKRSDVVFQPLNPLRGDASPKAGVLWGDIKRQVPTGTLVQFRDGFSSPPHIHNITYRAVVISGEVHNDDPDAAKLWMGPGSFWTQPAGEVHITAARGKQTTIFLEILHGPYLVQPSKEAFDNGERPINIEARNVVWLRSSDTSWLRHRLGGSGPEMAFLWGKPDDGRRHGAFVRIPSGTAGKLSSTGDWLRAVVSKGDITLLGGKAESSVALEPGSQFRISGGSHQDVACGASSDCEFYVTSKGKFIFESQ